DNLRVSRAKAESTAGLCRILVQRVNFLPPAQSERVSQAMRKSMQEWRDALHALSQARWHDPDRLSRVWLDCNTGLSRALEDDFRPDAVEIETPPISASAKESSGRRQTRRRSTDGRLHGTAHSIDHGDKPVIIRHLTVHTPEVSPRVRRGPKKTRGETKGEYFAQKHANPTVDAARSLPSQPPGREDTSRHVTHGDDAAGLPISDDNFTGTSTMSGTSLHERLPAPTTGIWTTVFRVSSPDVVKIRKMDVPSRGETEDMTAASDQNRMAAGSITRGPTVIAGPLPMGSKSRRVEGTTAIPAFRRTLSTPEHQRRLNVQIASTTSREDARRVHDEEARHRARVGSESNEAWEMVSSSFDDEALGRHTGDAAREGRALSGEASKELAESVRELMGGARG
ncbi:hypothetical protein LTS09_016929, partial [Friedmanniomyces endolithicus]